MLFTKQKRFFAWILFHLLFHCISITKTASTESSPLEICAGNQRVKRGLWEFFKNLFRPTPVPVSRPICRDNWMSELPRDKTDIFLGQLVIPGSHNAFCTQQDFSEESDLGADIERDLLPSLDLPRTAFTSNKDFLMKWSVTQSLATKQQLDVGIRFFDLRIAKHKTSGDLHIVHGLMGKKLQFHLEAMKPFLDYHPKEIVFLYFQKYYNMDTTDGLKMSRQLHETFGSKICKPTDFGHVSDRSSKDREEPPAIITSLTLNKIWRKGCQVFLFTHLDQIINDYITYFDLAPFFWEDVLDYDGSWSNTNSIEKMKSHANERLQQRKSVWRRGQIYALQAVLTPTALDIVFRPGLKDLVPDANKEFGNWMSDKDGMNIIVADFVENNDIVGKIISKNY